MRPKPPSVCAIVLAGPDLDVQPAVRAQTRPVDEVILEDARAGTAAAFGDGLARAMAGTADWFWLLDSSAVPEPPALELLLAPLADPDGLPRPAMLASKVVDPDGRLSAAAEPMPRLTRKEVAIEACRRRMVSLRAARHGSLLVGRWAVELYGYPRRDYVASGDDLEWTARMLRADVGYLVPQSVAVRSPGGAENHYRNLRNRARMLRGDAWEGEEKLWFGFLLGQDVVRETVANPRPRTLARALMATVDGLRGAP